MSLGETEVAVKAVDQNLEGVLQRVKILLLGAIFRGTHARLRLQPERTQIGEQMTKNLELIGCRPAIELKHDGGIEGRDTAMPEVARNAGEKDRGIAAWESAPRRHLGNGMALLKIFAKEERV